MLEKMMGGICECDNNKAAAFHPKHEERKKKEKDQFHLPLM